MNPGQCMGIRRLGEGCGLRIFIGMPWCPHIRNVGASSGLCIKRVWLTSPIGCKESQAGDGAEPDGIDISQTFRAHSWQNGAKEKARAADKTASNPVRNILRIRRFMPSPHRSTGNQSRAPFLSSRRPHPHRSPASCVIHVYGNPRCAWCHLPVHSPRLHAAVPCAIPRIPDASSGWKAVHIPGGSAEWFFHGLDFPGIGVECQVPQGDRFCMKAKAPQRGLDPGAQFLQPERLGNVIFRAQPQATDLVRLCGASGDDNDGQFTGLTSFLPFGQHFKPVFPRSIRSSSSRSGEPSLSLASSCAAL